MTNRERRMLIGYLVVLAILAVVLIWGIATCGCSGDA